MKVYLNGCYSRVSLKITPHAKAALNGRRPAPDNFSRFRDRKYPGSRAEARFWSPAKQLATIAVWRFKIGIEKYEVRDFADHTIPDSKSWNGTDKFADG
jgi:hypothetical protein